MIYEYEVENKNYEDFASGRVLYNQSGATAFPVRLTSEIYQRCKKHLSRKNINGPYTILDPCCGGGFMLTTIGFLHGKDLGSICASDIDERAVSLAKKNLSLLTYEGINERISHIQSMIDEYGKESHVVANLSANKLKDIILENNINIKIECLQTDVLNHNNDWNNGSSVDLVITDVPYGDIVEWSDESDNIIEKFLDKIYTTLKSTSVVAVIADKKQLIKNDKYKRIEYFKVGKRQVAILEPKEI